MSKKEYNVNDLTTLSPGVIYLITNDLNSKVYVGQTTGTARNRFLRHARGSDTKNPHPKSLSVAMQTLGVEHFSIKEIERVPKADLSARERYWIQYYNSVYPNGYNLNWGTYDSYARSFSDAICLEIVDEYKNGTPVQDIIDKYETSANTFYSVIHASGTPLRGTNIESSRKNFLKASESNQIPIKNITLNIRYESKRKALEDMIEKGYSKAKSWLNIRSPLDRALSGKQSTFLGFEWRYVENEQE